MKFKSFALTLALACCTYFIHAKKSEAISLTHDGLTLSGRIQFPDGAGPFQVVIVVPGSGANDKDGTLPMQGEMLCAYTLAFPVQP